jgi:hypothetical protein
VGGHQLGEFVDGAAQVLDERSFGALLEEDQEALVVPELVLGCARVEPFPEEMPSAR